MHEPVPWRKLSPHGDANPRRPPGQPQGPGNGPAHRRTVRRKTLGDFGAEVIKIEPPGVATRCATGGCLKNGTSSGGQVQSRNKRSVALDLQGPEAQEIVRKLAREADVLIENFRPARWKAGASARALLEPTRG
jgi:hypothetical protein